MKTVLLLVFLLLALVCDPGIADAPEGYDLVWADNFDYYGRPDPTKWDYEVGFVRNHEAQWYQPQNAFLEDGCLVIKGRQEEKLNSNYDPTSKDWRKKRPHANYTSACLHTKRTYSWMYGILEVRAKIVTKEGLWPAIWTQGVEGEWPSNGEVDLMEFYGGNIHANAAWGHFGRWQAIWDRTKVPVLALGDEYWDQAFHTWTMDWDDERIVLSLDGEVLNVIDLSFTINKSDRGPSNPFHQPHFLLLNLALGGTAGGNLSSTQFPSRYEVEYVRVYQKSKEQTDDSDEASTCSNHVWWLVGPACFLALFLG